MHPWTGLDEHVSYKSLIVVIVVSYCRLISLNFVQSFSFHWILLLSFWHLFPRQVRDESGRISDLDLDRDKTKISHLELLSSSLLSNLLRDANGGQCFNNNISTKQLDQSFQCAHVTLIECAFVHNQKTTMIVQEMIRKWIKMRCLKIDMEQCNMKFMNGWARGLVNMLLMYANSPLKGRASCHFHMKTLQSGTAIQWNPCDNSIENISWSFP